ncbi:divergent PAP2 family protein [Candidatus Saccharibacteria bacterium]|nr:divergent PAP2 family protein [Candidatus Saccharibacteria bacterium]
MEEWVVKWQYIAVIGLGWAVAQFIKAIGIVASRRAEVVDVKNLNKTTLARKFWRALWISGGMPSSHTSIVVSTALYIGLVNGFTSAIFGLALCFAVVVIYDAVNVRYAVGMNALTLNKVIKHGSMKVDTVKVVKGHTVAEAIGGFFVGVLVGFFAFWLFGGDFSSIFATL